MTRFRQCRLSRAHTEGRGHEMMVTYLPLVGSNGVEVATGRTVVLTDDADSRPWLIEHASTGTVDDKFLHRKYGEGRDRRAAAR